jgi:hypothetical protein
MGWLFTWHKNVPCIDLCEIKPLLVDVLTIEHWLKAIVLVQVVHSVCDASCLILGSQDWLVDMTLCSLEKAKFIAQWRVVAGIPTFFSRDRMHF